MSGGVAECLHAAAPHTAEPRPPVLWGLDLESLHDRYWAAHGVDVVRRGQRGPTRPGGCYLLLDPRRLVLFDPTAGRRLGRRGLLGVHVIDVVAPAYTERVTADDDGRLLSLQRDYRGRRRATRLLMTRDRALAVRWRSAESRRRGRFAVRVAAGIHGERRTRCRGRIFDAADPRQAGRFRRFLIRRWDAVGEAILPAREVRPDVWAHVNASIDPAARLVGPLWIGAGVSLGPDDIVVGPAVLHDRVDVKPPLVVRALGLRALSKHSAGARRIAWRVGAVKRFIDLAAGILGLAVTAPLFPLIMLAIFVEDGRPVLFMQRRQTLGGRPFTLCKFRTMCRDAERRRDEIAKLNVCDGPHFHVEDDPRLLKVGRLLRRFHLDELPQLFNVLRGDMSLIGPRPSPADENRYCPPWREARLSVRPGLTGLWQIRRTRAPQSDFQEWIRHDLDYVSRQGLRMDLMIVTRTAWQLAARLRPRRAA